MKRNGRLRLLTSFGLTTLLGCQASTAPPSCAQRPLPEESFRILWAGDTLLGDAAQDSLDANGYSWPLMQITGLFNDIDAAVANLEAPITLRTVPFEPMRPWSYNAHPDAAVALAQLGITAAGLANNHAMDRGPFGLSDTIVHLQAAGITPFGAGENEAQAIAPLIIETPYGRLAVLGLGQHWSDATVAGPNKPGSLAINPTNVRMGLQAARAMDATWTVAFVHWGQNYAPITHKQTTQHVLLSAFDQVIGHGSHTVQPLAKTCRKPSIFSLGNFVFGTPGRFTDDFPGYGLVTYTHLTANGIDSLEFACIRTDNRHVNFQPRPCDDDEADTVYRALHPDIQTDGSTAWLSLGTSR